MKKLMFGLVALAAGSVMAIESVDDSLSFS